MSEDLLAAYEHARGRLEGIRAEWDAQGGPILGEGSTGQLVEHALHRLLRDQERHVAQLADLARVKHRGPDVKAVRETLGLPPSRAAKVRAIGSAGSRRKGGGSPKPAG